MHGAGHRFASCLHILVKQWCSHRGPCHGDWLQTCADSKQHTESKCSSSTCSWWCPGCQVRPDPAGPVSPITWHPLIQPLGPRPSPLAPASVALLQHLHVQRHAAQLGAAAQVRHLYHARALRHLCAHLAQRACMESEERLIVRAPFGAPRRVRLNRHFNACFSQPGLLTQHGAHRAIPLHLRPHLGHSPCAQ
jgi:hypothetical protein